MLKLIHKWLPNRKVIDEIAIIHNENTHNIALFKSGPFSEDLSFSMSSHGGGYGIKCHSSKWSAEWVYHWRDGGGGGIINGIECFISSEFEKAKHSYALQINGTIISRLTLDGTTSKVLINGNPKNKVEFAAISILSYFRDLKTAKQNASKFKTTTSI